MPECAKTHLQQSRISKFSGGGPPDPRLQREGREGEGRENRREGGRGRIGKGGEGQGREGGREGRNGVGRGEEGRSTWAPPPLETSSGSAPGSTPARINQTLLQIIHSLHMCMVDSLLIYNQM